jgi:hypothetical protein
MAVVEKDSAQLLGQYGRVIPLVDDLAAASRNGIREAPLVMVRDSADVFAVQAKLKSQNPDRLVMIRLEASPAAKDRVIELTHNGAEVIHLVFDRHGREAFGASGRGPLQSGADSVAPPHPNPLPAGEGTMRPRHVRDVMRDIHRALVKDGSRDEITLVASGGIAQAEHMAKAIICGADLVAVDIPLLLAMECRLCGECERGELCPIGLEEAEESYAVHRVENLIGAWHQQLIEVLGAMGIREVRRLRGETGRAMFFEDLERDSFGRLFGQRKESII